MPIQYIKDFDVKNYTKGFIPISRQLFILTKYPDMSLQLFGFYLLTAFFMDWDHNHGNMYGKVKLTIAEIAEFLELSDSAVYRIVNKLKDMGLIEMERGVIKLVHPERFSDIYAKELKNEGVADVEEFLAKDEVACALVQDKFAEMRKRRELKQMNKHLDYTDTKEISSIDMNSNNDSKVYKSSSKGEYEGFLRDSNDTSNVLDYDDYTPEDWKKK